ncbi:MAG: FecR domain-containing protein [Defluviitaleaceae bacterium]|nr:FecR domain-containing protein [Defluviitaleaceae bacterium]
MKRITFRRLVAFLIIAVLSTAAVIAVAASNAEARIITIHRIEGGNVELARGARATVPRSGQRLSQGNVLSTGRDAQVYLSMDSDSLLKMDQQSQIVVSSAGSRLALTVQSGSALFDVGVQQTGQTTEVRIGNTGLVVRGTMFTASRVGDNGIIHMLSGLGEIEGGLLRPGYTVVVTRHAGGDITRIYPTVIEELDLFTLQAIADNAEYLTVNGVATPELLEALPSLKERAETRENAVQASVDRAVEMAIAGINGIPVGTDNQLVASANNNDGYVTEGGHPTATLPPSTTIPPDGGSGGGVATPPPVTATHSVTVSYQGANTTGMGYFAPGDIVTVVAGSVPPAHMNPLAIPLHWAVSPSGLPLISGITGDTITFIMPDHPVHLTIHWGGV